MREILLSLAVCVALAGCDNNGSSTSSAPKDGAARTDGGTKAAEPVKAAAKHPWGSFKKGSFVKTKTVMDMTSPAMKTETTTTTTLKDLTADEAVLEMETAMPNLPPTKMEQKFPLKAPEGKAADGPKPKTGSEEIEVAGKKMKCDWTETESEANGVKSVTRVYTNQDIPGFTAKMVMKNASMTMTTEVVEYSAK
jgi:hypothetical protein